LTSMPDEIASAEPEAARCATHPDVETYLRCGRCETPICPRCLVQTPVGARCKACARLRRLPMYDVGPRFILRGFAAGLAAAIVGGVIVHVIPNFGLIMLLLVGAAYGYVVAAAVSLVTNRKRGAWLGGAAAAAVLLGFIVSRSGLAYLQLATLPEPLRAGRALIVGVNPDFGFLLLLVVAALIAYNRLR
jgi:hypothetical protein